MPIGILEPFDHYASLTAATTGGFASVWTCGGTGSPGGFITGLGGQGKALQMTCGSNGDGIDCHRFFPRTNKITLNFAIRIDALEISSGASLLMAFRDSFTGSFLNQFSLYAEATNRFTFRGEAGAIVATATQVINIGQVFRFSITMDMVTHAVVTKINGGIDAGMTGTFDIQDAASTYVDNVYFEHHAHFNNNIDTTWVVDDFLVIYDELLDLPPLEMFTMAPTADVSVAFTRLSGAQNCLMVDDIPFDVDVTYNSSTTPTHKDIFQYGGLTKTPEYILCVSALNICKKDESFLRELRNVLRVGGVDYPASVVATLPENYLHYFTHWMQNPATVADWHPADFPLQLGYELMT